MKTLLLISIISFFGFVSVKPKTESNFKIVDKDLVWQKVYESNVAIDDYLIFIKPKDCLENIEVYQNMITGKLKRFKVNYKDYKNGVIESLVPGYIKDDDFKANVKIEFSGGKYRVTLSNIELVPKEVVVANERPSRHIPLKKYYYKAFSKSKPSDLFLQYSEPILNQKFESFFVYKTSNTNF